MLINSRSLIYCKKRVTCFDEWLDMKGCTEGPHNPVKPDKAQEVALSEREKAAKQGSQQAAQSTSSSNSPMVNLREEQRTTGDESTQKYIYAPPVEKEMEKLNKNPKTLLSKFQTLKTKAHIVPPDWNKSKLGKGERNKECQQS